MNTQDFQAIEGLELDYAEANPVYREEQYYGIAAAYSSKGFRDYIENKIKSLILTIALKAQNEKDVLLLRGKVEALKELMGKAKQAYENLNKIKSEHAAKGEIKTNQTTS